MADYYSLVLNCIVDVQVKVSGRDRVLLNRRQCGYLAQELLTVSESLRARGAESSLERGTKRTVLLHLHATVKRAQVLVTRCCCESSSWLAAAMSLGDIEDEVVAIILGLHQWSSLVELAMIGACSGQGSALQRAQVQELLEAGEERYQRMTKPQSKMQVAVRDAARRDQEELLERIAKHSSVGAEARRDEDFIRGEYLKTRLTHTEAENPQDVEKLKAYRLVDHLGAGGYGTVMKVEWWGQELALKILREIDRTEATLLDQVQHPNVVRLFHYWEEQCPAPHSRILMDLMPGDLQQHIKNALGKRSASEKGGMPFSLPVAIDTMLQVAQAMRRVYEKKLTHRDLKTSNILVKPVTDEYPELHSEGYLEAKLADFGSSKAYTNSSISGNLTRNVGTTVYGAPEIFGKEQIAWERNFPPKADVWSFGMTCSEILTGKAPFADDTARSTLHTRIVKNGLRPDLPRDCPEYVRFCIRSCWELQPQRRPSFGDLCRMLKHAKLLSLGLMDVESCKWLFAYQTGGGALKSSVLPLQPQDDSWISRFGFERIWRNLLGAAVWPTAGNSSPIVMKQVVLKPDMISLDVLHTATREFHSDMRLGEVDSGSIDKPVLLGPAYGGAGCVSGPCSGGSEPAPPGGGSGWSSFLSKAVFEGYFPNRNPFYTYEAFQTAARAYPTFGTSGTLDVQKRELAAFLGNLNQASGGLRYVEEINKENTYCQASTQYPCAPGKKYYGRGPILLSWNFNYGAAGAALQKDLLANPDLVVQDPATAWQTALWFWMERGPHAAILGNSFSGTIRAINSRECNKPAGSKENTQMAKRVKYYRELCRRLSVDPGTDLEC